MICVSETCFDSSILNGEEDISFKEYSLVRAGHRSNTKRGGGRICYKESPSVRIIDTPNLTASNFCQVTINKKRAMFL